MSKHIYKNEHSYLNSGKDQTIYFIMLKCFLTNIRLYFITIQYLIKDCRNWHHAFKMASTKKDKGTAYFGSLSNGVGEYFM